MLLTDMFLHILSAHLTMTFGAHYRIHLTIIVMVFIQRIIAFKNCVDGTVFAVESLDLALKEVLFEFFLILKRGQREQKFAMFGIERAFQIEIVVFFHIA